MIGPLLGGFIVEYLSWRWIFFVNLPFGIIAVSSRPSCCRAGTRVQHVIDYTGIVVLVDRRPRR